MRFARFLQNRESPHAHGFPLIHQGRKGGAACRHHLFRQALAIPSAHATTLHIRRRRGLEARLHPIGEPQFQLRHIHAHRQLIPLVIAHPDFRHQMLGKFPGVKLARRDDRARPFRNILHNRPRDGRLLRRTHPQLREAPRDLADGLAGFPVIFGQAAQQQLHPLLQISIDPPPRQPRGQHRQLIHMHAERHTIVALAGGAMVIDRILLALVTQGVGKKLQPFQLLPDHIRHPKHQRILVRLAPLVERRRRTDLLRDAAAEKPHHRILAPQHPRPAELVLQALDLLPHRLHVIQETRLPPQATAQKPLP